MAADRDAQADRTAVIEVIARYFQGLDRRNAELLLSCFSADVRIEYFGGAHIVDGIDTVREFFRFDRDNAGLPGLDRMEGTTHLWNLLDITLDGNTATSTISCVAYLLGAVGDEHVLVTRGLTYEDEFRLDPAGWVITRRRHLPTWESRSPATKL